MFLCVCGCTLELSDVSSCAKLRGRNKLLKNAISPPWKLWLICLLCLVGQLLMKENLNRLYIKANQHWGNAADFLCSLLINMYILISSVANKKLLC